MASKGRIEGTVYDEWGPKIQTSNIDVSKRYRELLAADARRWHGMRGLRSRITLPSPAEPEITALPERDNSPKPEDG